MIVAFRGAAAAFAVALALPAGAADAQAPAAALPPPLTLEWSAGYESLSSPVIRIDPDTALVQVEGDSRLRGGYGRIAANVFREFRAGDAVAFAASARIDAKIAPRARDLDFALAQADLTARIPVAGASFGIGPSLGHVRVAGERFRDAVGWRADVAAGDGREGHWALVADGGRQRHGPGFEDLDARVESVSIHRRVALDAAALSAVEAEAGLSRTRNRRGLADLANRGHYARLGGEARLGGMDASLAVTLQGARFDESAFEGQPARRDRFLLVDLGVSKDLGGSGQVRADFAWGRNRANLAAFDNRLRSASLAWIVPF